MLNNVNNSNKKTMPKLVCGFTLIEIMVSVALFAIVVMISMTAILSVVDSNKRAQSMKSVMNNLNFALETMTRSIKTGEGLSIEDGSVMVYDQFMEDDVMYSLGTLATSSLVRTIDGKEESITAPEVIVSMLKFTNGTLDKHPSVIMNITGHVKMNERVSSEFNIQTTVTQRLPSN